jgi:competence protein ComEC
MTGHHTGSRIAGLCAGWLAGIGAQLQEAALRPLVVYELAVLGGMLWMLAGWRWRRFWVLAVLGAALAAFGGAGWHATLRIRDTLPSSLEGQDLVVTGVIDGLPQRGPSGIRFHFEVETATMDGVPVAVPPLIALGWYSGFHEDAVLSQPQLALGAGQRWRFGVKLKQPHGLLNPHGFDTELNLLEQGVRATGHVRDGTPPRLLDQAAGHPVERLRQRVRDAIESAVTDHRAAGVLAALAVGDQSAIDWFASKLSWSERTRSSQVSVARRPKIVTKKS